MIVLRPSSERTGAAAASGKSAAICARESSSSASCSRRSVRASCSFPWAACSESCSWSRFAVAASTALCRAPSRISVAWIFPSSGSAPSRSFFASSSWVRKRILAGCEGPIFDSRSESILAVSVIVAAHSEFSLSEGDEESAFAAGAPRDFAEVFLCNSATRVAAAHRRCAQVHIGVERSSSEDACFTEQCIWHDRL